MPLTRISITIPEELVEAADQAARGLDRSRSWLVVEALKRYLARQARPDGVVAESVVPYRVPREGPPVEVVDAAAEVAEARRLQLASGLRLTLLERLKRAEELGRLGRAVQRRERGGATRVQIIGFDSYDDYYRWKRTKLIGA